MSRKDKPLPVFLAQPVALLLHGTGASTHSWRGLTPLLRDRFTVVAPDLPAHGGSGPVPSGGAAKTLEWLGELIRQTDSSLLDEWEALAEGTDRATVAAAAEPREPKGVTANTRADGAAFLRLARNLRLAPAVTRFPLAGVDAALHELRDGEASGSLVVTVAEL